MTRTRWMIWTGVVLALVLQVAALASASAQEPARRQVPRTLRAGTPASRLPTRTAKQALEPARPSPAPSIDLDSRPNADPMAGKQRNAALLQREIAVLQRLIAHTPRTDLRRADALLRLSYAYLDLMLMQKERLYRLEAARGESCRRCGGTAIATRCAPTTEQPLALAQRK